MPTHTDVERLETVLQIACTPSHPKRHGATLLLHRDPYYSMLPGMKQFVRLLNRYDEQQDEDALQRAVMLAGFIVQGMSVIEDGIDQAGAA